MPNFVKYFISALTMLLLFTALFLFYNYNKEKSMRELHMKNHLYNINEYVYNLLDARYGGIFDKDCVDALAEYVNGDRYSALRLTIISAKDGKVLFDSSADSTVVLDNHLQRPEVVAALLGGVGEDIRRFSSTLGEEFFYVATYDKSYSYLVRSAIPVASLPVGEDIPTEYLFFCVAIVVIVFLVVIFYRVVRHMGSSQFATQKLLTHLRIAQEGLAVFDTNGNLVIANNLFSKYCDLISAHHLSDISMLLEQPEFRAIEKFLESEKTAVTGKEPCFSDKIEKDGRTYSRRCVRFVDGGFEISINDITQSEEQSRLKQQLTQNVAHEFKTPVSSIQGYLETIIQNYPHNLKEEQLKHFLQRCYSQSNRLNSLVTDISQLNEMSESPQTVKKEVVDLSAMVESMLQEINNRLVAHGIKVNNGLPDKLFLVGDASLLYSVFRNLFDNAIAYAGDGSTIRLSCYRNDERFYYFSFSDNGTGVPEEHLTRIFERFYRVDKGRSRKLGGTGLGLAIVKNAVVLHGGTISARRSHEGGLELVFTLQRLSPGVGSKH